MAFYKARAIDLGLPVLDELPRHVQSLLGRRFSSQWLEALDLHFMSVQNLTKSDQDAAKVTAQEHQLRIYVLKARGIDHGFLAKIVLIANAMS